MIPELPREIQYMIIRKLDIDTRRSLGIFTKLRIPEMLQKKLKEMPKILQLNENVYVNLPFSQNKMYQLVRYIVETIILDFRIIHTSNDIKYHLIWSAIDD
jgi:hypothetical protein